MKIFTCADRLEDMLTCIYEAWKEALVCGHDQVQLVREPVEQLTLFDTYVHVDSDMEKVTKVVRSIQRDISNTAYMWIYYASLSHEADALDAIYRFLVIGFRVGASVTGMLGEPAVMRVMELRRRVGNEGHFFREMARFTSINNNVYVSHIEPKDNIALIVGAHFADRMPSEYWMIIDDQRHLAVVHPKDGENFIRYLNDQEFSALSKTEDYEDEYTELWRTFFDTISIKERENAKCQRTMFPIWMRKHAVEFEEK